MVHRSAVLAIGIFAFVATAGGTAHAQSKCAGEKIKAAGKKTTCKSGLEAKQASKGGTIDPAKVAKCESKLSSTFAKNEAKGGCTTTGDAATVEAKVDAFVADLDTELAVGTLPNKCQGEKIKAAGKKAACKLSLEAKQASKGGTIDPAKVAKCESKLSSAFAKQEAGGACNTTGDAAAIEAKVDAFVADADTEVNPTTTTTTTSATTTTTTSTTATTSTTTTTTTTSTTTTMVGTPPCAGTASPACDGFCPPGTACGDPGGGCACVAFVGPCGTAVGPPACYGECPGTAACMDLGGTCGCLDAAGPPVCAPGPGVPPPSCDGACAPGAMCADPGGGCMCVPTAGPCGPPPFPDCLGDCPPGTVCRSTFPPGGCACLPG